MNLLHELETELPACRWVFSLHALFLCAAGVEFMSGWGGLV